MYSQTSNTSGWLKSCGMPTLQIDIITYTQENGTCPIKQDCGVSVAARVKYKTLLNLVNFKGYYCFSVKLQQ